MLSPPKTLRESTLKDLQDSLQDLTDPYWPKWDGPWWQMLLLTEMGIPVPESHVKTLLNHMQQKYLPFFPLREAELPENCDPYRDILCFCALGSVLKLSIKTGIDPFHTLPWTNSWFEDYLLPDGGYNCDEQAYLRTTPRSSVTSSLPMYEALLLLKPENLSSQRLRTILLNGADYLQQREFCKSLSKNTIADPNWLIPGFPLFYAYDVIRGMQFVVDVHRTYALPLDTRSFAFALDRIENWLASPQAGRTPTDYDDFSLRYEHQTWKRGKAKTFPLLDWVCQPEHQRVYLLQRYQKLRQELDYFLA